MDRHGWNERYGAREQTFTPEPNRLIAAEVEGLRPGRAIDLAAGEGRHSVWLAALGWDVVAVDFSEVGLRRAQARARAQSDGGAVRFAVADVHRLRFPPGWFDLVVASFFHPRPPERATLYAAVARTLAPGGSLVMVTYDKANVTEGTGGPQDPELLMDPPVFARELEALGLHVVRAETVRLRTTTLDGEEVDVVDGVIHAKRPGPW